MLKVLTQVHTSARIRFRGALDGLILVCILLATRIPFRSHYLYDIDSVNFALALRRFDPAVHQPHPPGYFLYIWAGGLVNSLCGDANTAFVSISIASGCGALIAIYALAGGWFDRRAAISACLIFIFSPLAWFHGTVALTYAVEGFFSSLAGYLCWKVYDGSRTLVVPAAITVGLAAGFRPSFLLFIGPLLVFSVVFAKVRVGGRHMTAAGVALVAAVSAWLFPMIIRSGGLSEYWSALVSLWRTVPAKQTVLNSPVANSIARLVSIAGIFLLCFGCASLLAFKGFTNGFQRRRETIFVLIWIAPGLLFFTLVFLKFVNSGYLLVISPPCFAWLGAKASAWYGGLRFGARLRILLTTACAMFNTIIFLYSPVYCSYSSVRHFEKELEDVLKTIPQFASAADTMIVGFDSHFLGYRHAGYYLPGWFTAQYPVVRLASGTRVFVMEHGDTRLADKLPVARYKSFLLFPLPANDREYTDYVAKVRARFPKGALRTVNAGRREFTIGRTGDLQLLFPVAAGTAYSGEDVSGKAVNGR
jgi:4-amino-4-deoxy-L-arabinose transferase-like glycosyltransferase